MALKEAGIRLTLQGEAEYVNGLKRANAQMKALQTESKAAMTKLRSNAKAGEVFRTSMTHLGKQLDNSKSKIKLLESAQDSYKKSLVNLKQSISETTAKHAESASKTEMLKQRYEEIAKSEGKRSKAAKEANAAYKESKTETNALAKEVYDLNTSYDRQSAKLDKLPQELANAELASAKLRKEIEKTKQAFYDQGGDYAEIAKKWIDSGTELRKKGEKKLLLGSQLTAAFTKPLIAGFKSATIEAGKFHTEIGQLGPLLTNGGEITASVRKEMSQLGTASRQWAIDYAKSTTEINQGMAELIRNGYTSSQVLGMMPNILDASLASGEGFNAVMTTSSQVLSQFNLKGKNTTETLKNTRRVTDSLTYVANATASGFTDLGAGMAYVGPVANSLNMTVEETASILGILSNKGIEASAGGTALRGALTRLLKPSKQNAVAMAKLGISAEAFQKGTVKLPDIIDSIKNNTKGWTDEQRAAAIAMAFGTEAQTAMNALVEEGGDALRTLTKESENASGATKKVADSMKELPEFKYQQLVSQVKDLGIELGSQLLPIAQEAMTMISGLVKWFNSLDEGTKKLIVRAGLFVAALGPMISALGTVQTLVGGTKEVIGKLIQNFGKKKAVAEFGEAVIEMGDDVVVGATNAGAAAGLFSNPWVVAGAVATTAIAGFVAYMAQEANAPFAAHNESVAETQGAYQEWFNAVTEGAKSIEALNTQAQKNAEETTNTYKKNVEEVMKANREVQERQEKMWSNKNWWENLMYNNYQMIELLGGKTSLVFDNLRQKMAEMGQEEPFEQIIPKLQDYTTTLGNALSNTITHMNAHTVVTDGWANGQITQIKRVTEDVVQNYEQQKQAEIQALDQKRQNLNKSQEWYDAEVAKVNATYTKKQQYVQQAEANISHILQTAATENRALTQQETLSMLKSYQQLAEGAGQSLSTIPEAMNLIGDNLSLFVTSFGLDFLASAGLIDEATAKMIAGLGTTEERTNALKKALEGVDGFTAEPTVTVSGEEELQRLVALFGGDWASLSDEQKTALAEAKGIKELSDLLVKWGVWSAGSPIEAKQAAIQTDQAMTSFVALFEQLGLWNNSDFLGKIADIDTNAPDFHAQVAMAISEWSGIPLEEVKHMMISTNAPEVETEVSQATQAVENADGKTANVNVTDNGTSRITMENLNQFVVSAGVSDNKVVRAHVTAENAKEATGQISDFGATADANSSKSVSVTSSLIGMVANLVTMGLYKVASDGLADKSVTATTSVPSMTGNTTYIKDYNTHSGLMKNTSANAMTYVPGMVGNTQNVKGWNSTTGQMTNRSSTASTYTPNIAGNTSAVWSWIRALGSVYSTSSTITTYVDKVYRTFGKHATGGHIGMFAEGGNITRWGGLFAKGGNVPVGYTGIVGEAGPEIFQVTKKGVSITPLSTHEKMRGIKGVLAEQGESNSANVVINVNIDRPLVKEGVDIDALAIEVGQKINQKLQLEQLFKKGRVST